VQCTRIVAWLEHRDHARDIDHTRWAVRHVQFRIMSTYNGRDPTPSVMLVQWSIFPTMAIAGFKQEGGWVRAHRTPKPKIKSSYVARYSTWNYNLWHWQHTRQCQLTTLWRVMPIFCLPTDTLKAKSLASPWKYGSYFLCLPFVKKKWNLFFLFVCFLDRAFTVMKRNKPTKCTINS
jgi:hypothetical protein